MQSSQTESFQVLFRNASAIPFQYLSFEGLQNGFDTISNMSATITGLDR